MTDTSPKGSLTFEALTRLRDEIIQGKMRPNERLIAADLAERLNTSRTPIREALQLLEAEQLVVAAKRGYVVREHTKEEIVEIYEVRAALEGMAARLAAQKTGTSAYREIEAIGAHRDSLITSNDRKLIVDLNDEFHAAIFAACGNSRLDRINRSNSQHFFNYRISELYTKEETKISIKGHALILKAIKNHDADQADSAAQEHVLEALKVTLLKLR
ncbi:MAG: GntR family transcriptional regulator [Candidatus Nanopelagicales bacterium]|jgi:DNA-binding GntR family transcriptional regulator|nr:GntR family transcriptional regulator [Candidatus Nanopelagicales bacterium]